MGVNLPCIKSFWSRFKTINLGDSEGETPEHRAYYRMPFLGGKNGKRDRILNGEGLPLGIITRQERDTQSTGSEERLWEPTQDDSEAIGSPESVDGLFQIKRLSRDGIMVAHTKVDVSKDES
ncbi:hypothetical protein VMCG_04953 [Cytospora schulzeri]|uniref:Uncharacterized protein n=1 Tax=Cytospora schulzeri TaxID=448051 RepID=A0A423WLX4_9PEZI|nr:hypothetical protein VMCG_04953 [Valsa malicola]